MYSIKSIFKFTMFFSVSLFFTACSSTSEVRELAKITAANSSLVNTELSSFAENRRKIAEERINDIALLSAEADQQQVIFQTYRQGAQAAAVIAGEKNKPNYATLMEELERTSNAILEYQKLIQSQQASIKTEILAAQQPLVIPKNDLSTISKKLGVLAKEPTYEEQLQFLTGFFSTVLNDIQAAKKASDTTINKSENKNSDVNDQSDPSPGN